MKIYAPVKNATGTYCSVRFVNGVGETNNSHLIEWFKSHGYKVEDVADTSIVNIVEEVTPIEPLGEESKEDETDLEAMTPNEIRDWAKANGYGSVIKNTRNKEKLIELLRG